ncbi:hypothetical protein [Bacillus sp. 7705b]|uniref:hypothetical protein n=1 Tax=Bacillus sp. 7705b TaxID=2028568 RepID=UPI000BAE1CE7|nr:hypothetical protein [Bacillus sp. 7705b]PAY13876.1 hypothetical protein CJU60_07260 [Bacillus sp. 7705b]
MVDIDNELFELYKEVSKVKKIKYFFIDSPFLEEDEEKVQEKNKIFLKLLYKIIFYLLVVFSCGFFLYKCLHGKMFLIVFGAIFLLVFIFAILSISKALTKFAKLSGYSGFHKLRREIIYKAFKKNLETRNYSINQIENYLLPYLKSINEDRKAASITTYLKIIIPSILVSMITSWFTLIINTAVEEPNLKQEEFNQVMILWLALGIEVIILGAFIYSAIHQFQNGSSYNKNYRLLETLFYNYLLEQGGNPSKKSKKKSKKKK